VRGSWKNLVGALAAVTLALTLAACGSDSGDNNGSSTQTTAPAGPIALDTAFGNGGIAQLPLDASTHDRFMAITVGPDGKTYAAGFVVDAGDQAMAVARIDANGALDRTFGKNGIAVANAAPGGKTAELARGVVVQSNGKIVIAGPAEHDVAATGDAARDTDVFLARFDTSGVLDSTFGTGGIARVDISTGKITTGTTFVGDNSWGLGTLPGDKLVFYGSALAIGADRTDSDYVLVGLTNTGAVDTAFGTSGKVFVDVKQSNAGPRNLFVQPDGKIVATGYSDIDGVVQPIIVRTSTTGVLDSTFGTNGVATAKVLPGVAESYAVSQQASNYILAGYGRGADSAEKVDLIVYRFTGSGTLDSSFGTAGVTRIDIASEDDRARNVMVLPDGRIVAAGSGKRDALDVQAMVAVFTKDGARDTTFGENGVVISDLGGPNDSWYGLALSADKKYIYVAGYKGIATGGAGNDDAVVARFKL
jgi:uncharacterized delta-60 repeat protein